MALLISKILSLALALKFGLIPLWIMDYSPWGSKNDGLKKFMQVEVDMYCTKNANKFWWAWFW